MKVQPALCCHRFCICSFKQPWIEHKWKTSRKFQKAKLEFASHLQLFTQYLHCIYNYLLLLFSRSVVSDSLWPHGLQHTRLLCPSPSPGACSNSCPLSQWCHPTISSSVAPLSSYSQSFPASEPFPKNWLFASGGQSIRVSASVLPMNIQGWFPLGLTALISLQSKGLSRVFSSTTVQKHQFFSPQPSLWSNSHPYMTIGKKHSFVYIDICQQRDVSAF